MEGDSGDLGEVYVFGSWHATSSNSTVVRSATSSCRNSETQREAKIRKLQAAGFCRVRYAPLGANTERLTPDLDLEVWHT
jgi:hypothetical protein